MRRQPNRLRLSGLHRRQYPLVFFGLIAVAALLGGVITASTRAATFSAHIEAESGTLQTAQAVQASGASGSQAVTFKSGSAGGGGGGTVSKTGNCKAPAGLKPTDLDASHGGTDQIEPWRHKFGDAATIYYATSALPAEYKQYINDGAAIWNVSPCIDIKPVDTCPAQSNCVVASMVNDNGGGSFDGVFRSKSRSGYLVSGTIEMVDSILKKYDPEYRKLVVVHEMGHSVSLGHRLSDKDIMFWSSKIGVMIAADKINLDNILAVYGIESGATRTALTDSSADGEETVKEYYCNLREPDHDHIGHGTHEDAVPTRYDYVY